MGAAFALLNNVLEMRTDGWKRLKAMQRPAPAHRAESIGAWFNILRIMSIVSVATNVGIITFTTSDSRKMLHLTDTQNLWLFIGLEHLFFMIKIIMMAAVPAVPEWVEKRSARDKYMEYNRQELILSQRLAKKQRT